MANKNVIGSAIHRFMYFYEEEVIFRAIDGNKEAKEVRTEAVRVSKTVKRRRVVKHE